MNWKMLFINLEVFFRLGCGCFRSLNRSNDVYEDSEQCSQHGHWRWRSTSGLVNKCNCDAWNWWRGFRQSVMWARSFFIISHLATISQKFPSRHPRRKQHKVTAPSQSIPRPNYIDYIHRGDEHFPSRLLIRFIIYVLSWCAIPDVDSGDDGGFTDGVATSDMVSTTLVGYQLLVRLDDDRVKVFHVAVLLENKNDNMIYSSSVRRY